jgi:diaminopimelate decarboxylase/aspartate kinase
VTRSDPWVVLKFGGTSVSSAECWETIAKILRERISGGLRPLVVCSALSQVSNRLEAALADALLGGEPSAFVASLRERHERLAAELGLSLDDDPEFGAELDRLGERLTGVSMLREASPRVQAEILSAGEMLSTRIGATWLGQQGLATRWLDARTLLAAEDHGDDVNRQYLSADCAPGADPSLAGRLSDHEEAVLLTQGFVVAGPGDDAALLGRGGSDTSATLLAERLGARHVEIWTDVAGLFSADPRIVPEAQRVARIGFDEAMELTTRGAKVLHPRSLAPARRAGVPIEVCCTREPASHGTVIDEEHGLEHPSAVAISSRHGMAVVVMDVERTWQQVGVIAEIAECFARHGLSIDSISSSQTRVTVSLDPSANSLDEATLARLVADLEHCSEPQVVSGVASVSIVGAHLQRALPGLPALMEALEDRRVYLLAHAANDHSLTFVIDEEEADDVVRRLHRDLLRSRDAA